MSDQALQRRYRFSIVRVLFCGVLLTVLSAVCLYVFYTAFDFCRDRFLEEESKTLAWFTLQLSLPILDNFRFRLGFCRIGFCCGLASLIHA